MKMLLTLPVTGMSRLEHFSALIYAELQGKQPAIDMSFEHDAELAVLAMNKAQVLMKMLQAMENLDDETVMPS